MEISRIKSSFCQNKVIILRGKKKVIILQDFSLKFVTFSGNIIKCFSSKNLNYRKIMTLFLKSEFLFFLNVALIIRRRKQIVLHLF